MSELVASDADAVRAEIASSGTLRVGINLSNMLLVTGKAADGAPEGVAPDMARAIAAKLGIDISLHPYPQAGLTADAIGSGEVDIGLIAHEPKRAELIAFTPAYCEIEATYMVPPGSPITRIEEVDIPGQRIAVANRAAYELYLSRTIRHAELVRMDGLPETFAMFRDQGLPVLAGLRPALIANAAEMPGARLLEGRYMTVQQAIGTQIGRPAAARFLADFAAEALASGFVKDAIERHGVTGKLIPA